MLKSFPIFRWNGAHLVEKKDVLKFKCFEDAKTFLISVKL
jgi:hypothetical protein